MQHPALSCYLRPELIQPGQQVFYQLRVANNKQVIVGMQYGIRPGVQNAVVVAFNTNYQRIGVIA